MQIAQSNGPNAVGTSSPLCGPNSVGTSSTFCLDGNRCSFWKTVYLFLNRDAGWSSKAQ